MLFILLVILLIELFAAYITNKKQILAPYCVACLVFLGSTVFAIIGNLQWGYSIHSTTVIIITSSLLIFGIGSFWGQVFSSRIYNNKESVELLIPTRGYVCFITFILLILSYLLYRDFLNAASSVQLVLGGFGGLLRGARDTYTLGRASSSILTSLTMYFSRGFSFVGIYLFAYITIEKNKEARHYWYLLLPSIPYLIDVILSTGRTLLTSFVVYVVSVFGIMIFRGNRVTEAQKRKFYRSIFKIAVAFVIAFILLQILRQGINVSDSSLLSIGINIFTIYIGFSIPSFDSFLVSGVHNEGVFGANTLMELYSFLRGLGIDAPSTKGAYSVFTYNGARGNLFTALRRYIEDYSLVGNFFIMLILGMISAYFFWYTFKRSDKPLLLILYSVYIYPVFELSIEERFLTSLGSAPLYNYIAITVCFWIFTRLKLIFLSHKSLRAIDESE